MKGNLISNRAIRGEGPLDFEPGQTGGRLPIAISLHPECAEGVYREMAPETYSFS
jgi:hypothetical protein